MAATPLRRSLLLTACVAAAALGALLAPPADAVAASRLYVRGAGFGHGVGMSQYGAYGYARRGTDYRSVLAHYYTGTAIGRVPAGRIVRVLLQSSSRPAFSGASRVNGRRLDPGKTYRVGRSGERLTLLSPRGRRLGSVDGVLRATGPRTLSLVGAGRYRSALEFRAAGGGVNAINALGLDDYVRGVVPGEVPASWPAEALKAQAVAARTYAITSDAGGEGFEQYADTRSQVFRGASGEAARADAAVRATRREVVTYRGDPVTTFFFSTSGGRTEDVENSFLRSPPRPWLKSVEDPYDGASPKHRWLLGMTLDQAGRKLGGLVRGSFRGIQVLRRGSSPRVVLAEVIGTQGRTRTTGPTLRARLGLNDTWAYFTVASSGRAPAPLPEGTGATAGGTPLPLPPGIPVAPAAARADRALGRLRGAFDPAPAEGRARVERLSRAGWVRVGSAALRRGRRFAFTVRRAGRYRAVRAGMATPVVAFGR